jgi:hypothetical protein
MPKRLEALTVAVLVVVTMATFAAFATRRSATPNPALPLASTHSPHPTGPVRPRRPIDPVLAKASAYALAARNWTPSSYIASWQAQVRLAGGRFRRALLRGRPGDAELGALRHDHARSWARLLTAARDPRIRPPNARVVVGLEEVTVAAGQRIAGPTSNEVHLRDSRGVWRVVGWTVVPGG